MDSKEYLKQEQESEDGDVERIAAKVRVVEDLSLGQRTSVQSAGSVWLDENFHFERSLEGLFDKLEPSLGLLYI